MLLDNNNSILPYLALFTYFSNSLDHFLLVQYAYYSIGTVVQSTYSILYRYAAYIYVCILLYRYSSSEYVQYTV